MQNDLLDVPTTSPLVPLGHSYGIVALVAWLLVCLYSLCTMHEWVWPSTRLGGGGGGGGNPRNPPLDPALVLPFEMFTMCAWLHACMVVEWTGYTPHS